MSSSKAPVFIIAPSRRSGTNFLASLIKYSNQFYIPELISEASFLYRAPLIETYVKDTVKHHANTGFWQAWSSSTNYPTDTEYHEKLLKKLLGNALLEYSESFYDNSLRLLIKIPNSLNIDYLFDLFPECKLIVLTRDGRDVIESATKSYTNKLFSKPTLTNLMKQWSKKAKYISQFIKSHQETEEKKWIKVRYESLIDDPEYQMKRIFNFTEVDQSIVDWDNIINPPIIGSSIYRGKSGSNELNFEKVEKPKDAQFTEKWKKWSFFKKILFKYYCGDALKKLDYVKSQNW